MITSIHFWLRLLICCLGLLGLGCLMTEIKRRRELNGNISILMNRKEKVIKLLPDKIKQASLVLTGFVLGAASLHLYQYEQTFTLSNIVVDSQIGTYVSYHFLYDPSKQSYSLRFCEDRYLPDFQSKQVIDHIKYVRTFDRRGGCEDLSPSTTEVKLVRVNGVPVLESRKGDD